MHKSSFWIRNFGSKIGNQLIHLVSFKYNFENQHSQIFHSVTVVCNCFNCKVMASKQIKELLTASDNEPLSDVEED